MRKPLAVGLAALALGTALGQKVQITFWHSMGGVLGEATEALVKEFYPFMLSPSS
jgi:sn-glycerol 3-phosphate transport system substrate-binding protein